MSNNKSRSIKKSKRNEITKLLAKSKGQNLSKSKNTGKV